VRKKAARNFVWTTVETTMPGTSGGESLSLSQSLFWGGGRKHTRRRLCVCVCEREREILRDSKGKFAMGGKKQNKTKTKFNLRSRIKQRNNAGS
jgi:hypothetical protein